MSVIARNLPQDRLRRVVAVHAVHPRAGRCGRRTYEQTRRSAAVRVESEAWPDRGLPWVVGAADDVAADEVVVARGDLGGCPRGGRHDAIAKTGRETLDLSNHRLRGIAGVAARHVRVGPDRVYVARRAFGIRQVL